MEKFVIEGGVPLSGTVTPAGNKNAALPLLAASLLTEEELVLHNVPRIRDVEAMVELLVDLGVKAEWRGDHTIALHADEVTGTEVDPDLAERIRASFLVAGPLLARFGEALLPPPGGDVIGRRRLDPHLDAFRALGADVSYDGAIRLTAPDGGLRACDFFMDEPSVMGTENALMAAAVTPGTSIIRNAASEPHVQDLARMLVSMGAEIDGIGSNVMQVHGCDRLEGTEHSVSPDHIEIGSFMALAGVTGGGPVRLRVRGPKGGCQVKLPAEDGPFEVRLSLRHDPWDLGETPLPPGSFRLRLQVGGSGPGRIVLDDALVALTPYVERSSSFRLRVERNPDGSAQLVLGPPLADDEVGLHAQHELRRWYTRDDHRLDPNLVYLQAYGGFTATDSPLAIHHELRRVRPELRLVWGAADSSVVVPEGAERVLLRSREFYRTIATCGHIVSNIDMDEWFRKRPGQRLLQTTHGYPGKAMGLMAWETRNFPPSLVERQLRRTSGTWDLLLMPHPRIDVHYREQYRYEGPILSAGYPRDDALLAPDAEQRRADARRRLGIGDRTAVLYAPTWRDDLTTNFRAALMPSTFDVEHAAEALGDDYVILLRGHRFHRRREVRRQLLDVTDYPEINDLILAADAGVLDYSSIRFDMALTGQPMIFLVPDLDRYESGRGFMYDFRSSAPGPLVDTTAEVVDALRDLDGVARRHAEEYARFNEEFNSTQDGRAAERVVEAFFGRA